MERDERIYLQWLVQLPVMSFAGSSISFSDYKANVTGANIDRRPVDQLNAEIDEVEKLLKGGVHYGT